MCVRFGSSSDASSDSPGAHEYRRRQTGEGFRRRLKVQIGEQLERRAKERRAQRPEGTWWVRGGMRSGEGNKHCGWKREEKRKRQIKGWLEVRRKRRLWAARGRWGESGERFAFGIRRQLILVWCKYFRGDCFFMQACVWPHTHAHTYRVCVSKRPVDEMIGIDLNA